MGTPFENYIQSELPRRPVLLTYVNAGYDGDPNSGGAPAIIANSPLGTLYLRSTGELYQKQSSAPGTWELIGGSAAVGLSATNKNMVASLTTSDGDVGCATGLASSLTGWVLVMVNGMSARVGNGVKTLDCYFSGDAGVTARTVGALQSGDLLYWNGSIAGYQLTPSDVIDFVFSA